MRAVHGDLSLARVRTLGELYQRTQPKHLRGEHPFAEWEQSVIDATLVRRLLDGERHGEGPGTRPA